MAEEAPQDVLKPLEISNTSRARVQLSTVADVYHCKLYAPRCAPLMVFEAS
jgi:hypothetical protein